MDFWGRICQKILKGCGEVFLTGWVNVFMPFRKDDGKYSLMSAEPTVNRWGEMSLDSVPPSTVEVPVLINDNGRVYSTLFYGGHIVSVYNPSDDTIRPSLDWAIIDVTKSLDHKGPCNTTEELCQLRERMFDWREDREYRKGFPEPARFRYPGK